MNIHHLELFYYVARFGGISEAVRKIPYGIQQPAVSAQVGQLEENLGLSLFQRRPFELTAAGRELFQFIQPFFENVENMATRLRSGVSQHVRLGASEIVLREHLPAVLEQVQTKFPNVRLTLKQGYQPELEGWIKLNEIDIAVTLLEKKVPSGVRAESLFDLPIVLLVNKKRRIKCASELFENDEVRENLISLPAREPIVRNFQDGLKDKGITWPIGMEVSSLALVESYVEGGHGIGLSVLLPSRKISAQLKVLPLEQFRPVTLGVLWSGQANPVIDAFLSAIKGRAATVNAAYSQPSSERQEVRV
jgi:DNA-binding transcriptional LysR family regulator